MSKPIQAVEVSTPKPTRPRLYIGVYHKKNMSGTYDSTAAYDEDGIQEVCAIATQANLTMFALPASDEAVEVETKLSTEQWIAKFREWIATHAPIDVEADDSRESIYGSEPVVFTIPTELEIREVLNHAIFCRKDGAKAIHALVASRVVVCLGEPSESRNAWGTPSRPLVEPPPLDPIKAIVELIEVFEAYAGGSDTVTALKQLAALKRSLGSGE